MKSNRRWTHLMDEDGKYTVFRKSKKCFLREENTFIMVGILGLEPRMTGPESVVLPLHHIPIHLHYFIIASAKVITFLRSAKIMTAFFILPPFDVCLLLFRFSKGLTFSLFYYDLTNCHIVILMRQICKIKQIYFVYQFFCRTFVTYII